MVEIPLALGTLDKKNLIELPHDATVAPFWTFETSGTLYFAFFSIALRWIINLLMTWFNLMLGYNISQPT